MVKVVSGVLLTLSMCSAAFAAMDPMSDIRQKISQTWHQPKVTRKLAVSLVFVIDKSGQLKSTQITKSSGDKGVDAAAVSAIKRAQPFAPLTENYSEMKITYTFECRPATNVDDYRLNGVPIKNNGYRITSGGATLKPLDTNSKAEEFLANRAQALGDKIVALTEKLARQEKSAGADSQALIPTLSELANTQKQLGKYDEADATFKRLIALEEKYDDKRNLATSLADYGDEFYVRAQWNQAEQTLGRAIASKKELGLSGPADIAVLEEYAKVLYKLNRASEAAPIYQEIKSLREK